MGDHEAHGREVTPDADAAEYGRKLFAQECRFIMGAAGVDDLPPDRLPEVAFAGRSNVGKSSLVNSLTGRRTLARTSNTPGRTRQVNFFDLGARLMLVDLPGYGFARAPKSEIRTWTKLLRDYLRGRVGLRRVCLLVDARHGLKDGDREMIDLLVEAAVPFRVVLTKADKMKAGALDEMVKAVEADLRRYPAAMPEVLVTSARGGIGVVELRADLAVLAAPERLG
jgi:GTP-binding protein